MSSIVLPPWASKEDSELVTQLLAASESEKIEFKECIPEQADKITKEIAAFATSGGGRILLGINNQGRVIGLGKPTPKNREKMVDRITGLWGNMNPVPKNMKCEECFIQDQFMLLITIPKQSEPAFFYKNTIYIRDHKSSRPATPDELKEIYFNWAKEKVLESEEVRSKQNENKYSELIHKSIVNLQEANHKARMNMVR